jgi:hypothetical protein
MASKVLIPSIVGYLGGSSLCNIVIASCTNTLVQRMACDAQKLT